MSHHSVLIIFQADTARIVWSWQTNDPTNGSALVMHNFQGATSLNLLGGLPNPPQDPVDVQSFDITISDVSSDPYSYPEFGAVIFTAREDMVRFRHAFTLQVF